MPSVRECVSETHTNLVCPAGLGVSYGIGSTLKKTERKLSSLKLHYMTDWDLTSSFSVTELITKDYLVIN